MKIIWNEVTWYSKWGAVILFLIILPTLTFYIGREYEETMGMVKENSFYVAQDLPKVNKKSLDPLNATYQIDDEKVTLKNGVATSAFSETRVFGEPVKADLNNDGVQDAVFFLSQETSGTGIFFYVVAFVGEKGTKAIFLGDRIAPQNIGVNNGVVSVNYATRRDNEPMTKSPSLGVTKNLIYRNGMLVEQKVEKDVFEASPRPSNQSNVVGFFDQGAFVFNNVPDWIVSNWTGKNPDQNTLVFTPREEVADRDFSDIVIETDKTTESFNADSIYNSYSKSNGMQAGKLLIAEIFLNEVGDTRIYHVQRLQPTGVEDTFYLDGNGKTAIITFTSNPDNYVRYGAKIKEFVQGIGKGGAPRG